MGGPDTGASTDPRAQLLAGLPVTERRLDLAGVSTAFLEGGQGPPLLLLHGPMESATNWRWVLGDLVRTHHVIAADLPAHGESAIPDGWGGPEQVRDWLAELIERTCPSPPAIVGHVLGGAIAARFAASRSDPVDHLVLVDALGLARFRPAPRFALGLVGLQVRPTERSYTRFMRQCAYDLDTLRDRIGDDWDAFVAHNLDFAQSAQAKAAGRLFRELGLPRIPDQELARITTPVTLIWGRHDRANRLAVARAASARHDWPLHVIDDAADDPARDRPVVFCDVLRGILE